MSEEPREIAVLEECLESVIDYRGKTPPKSPSGIPTITAANIKSGRINMSTVSYVSEETYRAWTSRGFPQAGDVLITTEAPVGEVAPFPGDQTYLITRRVFAMRGKKSVLDSNYLLYTCLSPVVQDELASRIRGSTVPRVLKTDILGLRIPLPPLPEQRAIAHVLGTLDDKIELNRKTNETLEAMARSLFQSWFVDFDPVRAKAEGRPTGLPDEISDLFPDSFEESELGEIPGGWEVKALDQIAHFLNGLALQKFPPGDGGPTLPVIKIAQLKKGDALGADRCSTSVPEDYVIRDGDVLFSWSGSLAVDIWCGGDGALNQHLFKVTSKTYGNWFFYQWVKHHLPDFQEIAQGKATTMGHIQRHHLSEAKALIPTPPLLGAMDSVFASMLDRSFVLRKQSRELSCIRDALLPKLISGELRIPEAEKLLEQAGV